VLLVGNHSGGTLIADTFVFTQAFYDRFGSTRRSTSSRTTSCSGRPESGRCSGFARLAARFDVPIGADRRLTSTLERR
jgi:hypothetical protein